VLKVDSQGKILFVGGFARALANPTAGSVAIANASHAAENASWRPKLVQVSGAAKLLDMLGMARRKSVCQITLPACKCQECGGIPAC
jgi:hypothetical protein